MGLAALAVWTVLRQPVGPATVKAALIGATAIASMFALGVAGLALLRGRSPSLVVPGIGALVWSVVSLVFAGQAGSPLLFLGLLNAVLAIGLLSRAIRLDRASRSPPADSDPPT